MARLPVTDTPVCQGAEPDVFAKAFRRSKLMKVTTGPDGTAQPADSSFLNNVMLKTDFQKRGVSCFRWDKPCGFAASRKPASAWPCGSRRRIAEG